MVQKAPATASSHTTNTTKGGPFLLARWLACIMAVAFSLHAAGCGLFFCVRGPTTNLLGQGAYDATDVRVDLLFREEVMKNFVPDRTMNVFETNTRSDDLETEPFAPNSEDNSEGVVGDGAVHVYKNTTRSDERSVEASEGPTTADDESEQQLPKLIPNVLHQTYTSFRVPGRLRMMMDSWKRMNPDFSFRFYDDVSCLSFVRREFPEYLDAYLALPKSVERSDFFRYMVVLRLGGYYADVDTECRRPLAGLARPKDTLIVGWEGEFDSLADAQARRFVRQRQVLQWTFAAAPGHPALRDACDRIAERARSKNTFSNNTNVDTLLKTGPGLWTDAVVRAAIQARKSESIWGVRFLPRVAFGTHPQGQDGVSPSAPDVLVLHRFVGGWKRMAWIAGFAGRASPTNVAASVDNNNDDDDDDDDDGRHGSRSDGGGGGGGGSVDDELPLTTHQQNIAVDAELAATEKRRAVAMVSANWDPPFDIHVFPAGDVYARKGSLSARTSRALTHWGKWQFEPDVLPRSVGVVEPLVSAAAHNDGILLDVTPGLGFTSLAAISRRVSTMLIVDCTGDPSVHILRRSLAIQRVDDLVVVAPDAYDTVRAANVSTAKLLVEMMDVNATSTSSNEHVVATTLSRMGSRNVSALHLGAVDPTHASGWQTWALDVVLHATSTWRPAAVFLEFQPGRHDAWLQGDAWTSHGSSRSDRSIMLLEKLWELGYRDVAHTGRACDARWSNVTRGVSQARVMELGYGFQETLSKPSWCRVMDLEALQNVIVHVANSPDSDVVVETFLLTRVSFTTLEA